MLDNDIGKEVTLPHLMGKGRGWGFPRSNPPPPAFGPVPEASTSGLRPPSLDHAERENASYLQRYRQMSHPSPLSRPRACRWRREGPELYSGSPPEGGALTRPGQPGQTRTVSSLKKMAGRPPAALRGETLKSFNKLSYGKNKDFNLSFQNLIKSFHPFFPKNGLGAWGMKSPAHLVGHRLCKKLHRTFLW